jgi:hypothetical protein
MHKLTVLMVASTMCACHLLAQAGMKGTGAHFSGVQHPVSTAPFRQSTFNNFRTGHNFNNRGFNSGGFNNRGTLFSPFWGFDSFYGAGYADYFDDGGFGGYGAMPQQAQPSVVVVMPQLMPPPLPPPPPIRPEIRDYNWPASGQNGAAAFSLAIKNDGVQSAVAVCLEGKSVVYTASDGSQKSFPLDALDRKRTRELNAEKQLRLPWLPAGD